MAYQSTYTGAQIDTCISAYQNAAQVQAAINAAKLAMYPIGSIYMSIESTDPSTFIGGTWERIQDTFLLAAGTNFAAGSSGGEVEHTLTTNEMPEHTHTHKVWVFNGSSFSGGNRYGFGYSAAGSLANGSSSGEIQHYNLDAGGSQAHNNMPPYLSVYIWKRTA